MPSYTVNFNLYTTTPFWLLTFAVMLPIVFFIGHTLGRIYEQSAYLRREKRKTDEQQPNEDV